MYEAHRPTFRNQSSQEPLYKMVDEPIIQIASKNYNEIK